MNQDKFDRRIHETRKHLSTLVEEAAKSTRERDRLAELSEVLSTTLEELHVAQEELREQYDQLAVAREDVESELRRYQELFDHAPDGYIVTDPNGVILEANRTAAGLLGLRPPFAGGKPLMVYVIPRDRRALSQNLAKLNANPAMSIRNLEIWLQPRGATAFPVSVNASTICSDEEKPVGLRWTLREALPGHQTQDKPAPEETETERAGAVATRNRDRELFDLAPDGYLVTDVAGRIQEANPAACEMVGASAKDLLGTSILTCLSNEDREPVQTLLSCLEAGEDPPNEAREVILEPDEGDPIHVAFTLAAVRDAAGRCTGVCWLLRDVSERRRRTEERQRLLEQVEKERRRTKKVADRLRTERDLLGVIMANTDAHLAYLDLQFSFIQVNEAYARGSGHTMEELVGRNHFELFPNAENQTIFEKVRDTGEPVSFRAKPFKFLHQPERGTTYWDWTFAPVKSPSGEVNGLVLSLADVTERIRAQEDIEKTARFPSENPHPVLRVDAQGAVVYSNQAGAALLSEWQIEIGHPLPEPLRDGVLQSLKSATRRDLESRANGRIFQLSLAPIPEMGYVNIYANDITDAKRAEREREEYLARLDNLIRVSQDVLAARTVKGVLQRIVDAARELTGARLGTSGHGFTGGEFTVGAGSRAEDVPSCPPGERFCIERGGVFMDMLQGNAVMRLTDEELHNHLRWWGLPEDHAPLRGLLGVPLVGRDGTADGLIMVSDKREGEFTETDEYLLRQLASLASLGLQHIEARDKAEHEAEEREAVFQAMTEAVLVYNAEDNVIRANPAALSLNGFDPTEVDFPTLMDQLEMRALDGRRISANEMPSRRALRGETVRDERVVITDHQGNDHVILCSATPVRTKEETVQAVVVAHDITEMERAVLKLAASEEQLRLASSAAELGVFEWDIPSDTAKWENDRIYEIFGRAREEGPLTFAELMTKVVDPEDREDLERAMAEAIASDKRLSYIYRIRRKNDGQQRWLECSCRFEKAAGGSPQRMVGVVVDITERKTWEEELRDSEERFHRAAFEAPFPTMIHCEDGKVLLLSRSWTELTGYTLDDIPTVAEWRGRAFDGDAPYEAKPEDAIYERGRRARHGEFTITTKEGRKRRWEIRSVGLGAMGDGRRATLHAAIDLTERREAEDALRALRRRLNGEHSFAGIVGRHPAMLNLYGTIRELCVVDAPVLIQGESGTGKELVANAIHHEGRRAKGPFIVVNCAALPETLLESELFGHVRGAFTGAIRDKKGRFELAHGGTIFLDEIGDLSASIQVKLLRVLQEKTIEHVGGEKTIRVDVRIISATHKDLQEEVRAGRFREDLYYRLCVIPVLVPPLRQRIEDIPLIANHILKSAEGIFGRKRLTISNEAMDALMGYSWPGNVRELQSALYFAAVKTQDDLIDLESLPPAIRADGIETTAGPPPTKGGRRPKITPEQARRALAEAHGNKTEAALALGISRVTLYRHLSNLEDPDPSDP